MEYEQELREAGNLFDNCLERGLSYLKKARLFYGELEKHYLEAMDFDGIESCRKEVLERIINIVGEKWAKYHTNLQSSMRWHSVPHPEMAHFTSFKLIYQHYIQFIQRHPVPVQTCELTVGFEAPFTQALLCKRPSTVSIIFLAQLPVTWQA